MSKMSFKQKEELLITKQAIILEVDMKNQVIKGLTQLKVESVLIKNQNKAKPDLNL